MVSHMEKALTTAADVDEYQVALYGNINWDLFKAERTVVLAKCESDSGDGTRILEKVRQIMRGVLGRELLEYCKLLVIILSLPSTVCSAERSFSGLSRIKSKLCTTMRQTGMNAYAVFHLNKKFTDQLYLDSIADEFIREREGRPNICATSEQAAV